MTARLARKRLGWRAGVIAAAALFAAGAFPIPIGLAAAAPAFDAGVSECATKKRSKTKARSKAKKSAKPKPASGDAGRGEGERVTLESVTPRPRPVPGANPPQEAETPPQMPGPTQAETPAPPPGETPAPAPAFVPARMDATNPNRQPDYPMESRALGEQGRVVLWLEILPDGSVGRALIATSSLSPRLDAAALAAARTWHYVPAFRGGVPVTSGANVLVDFKLSN